MCRLWTWSVIEVMADQHKLHSCGNKTQVTWRLWTNHGWTQWLSQRSWPGRATAAIYNVHRFTVFCTILCWCGPLWRAHPHWHRRGTSERKKEGEREWSRVNKVRERESEEDCKEFWERERNPKETPAEDFQIWAIAWRSYCASYWPHSREIKAN